MPYVRLSMCQYWCRGNSCHTGLSMCQYRRNSCHTGLSMCQYRGNSCHTGLSMCQYRRNSCHTGLSMCQYWYRGNSCHTGLSMCQYWYRGNSCHTGLSMCQYRRNSCHTGRQSGHLLCAGACANLASNLVKVPWDQRCNLGPTKHLHMIQAVLIIPIPTTEAEHACPGSLSSLHTTNRKSMTNTPKYKTASPSTFMMSE